MESTTESTPMKSNSAVASIKLGYRLFAEKFKYLFKKSWLWAVLFGLVCGVIGPITTIKMPSIVMDITSNPANSSNLGKEYMILLGILSLLLIIGGIIEIVFYSSGLSLLHEHLTNGKVEKPSTWFSLNKREAWRTLKGVLASLLIVIAVGCVAGLLYWGGEKTAWIKQGSYVGLTIWAVISVLLYLIVSVPLIFTTMKYVLDEDKKYWRLLTSDFHIGIKHFGYILLVAIFACMVIAVMTFILQLPAVILSTANYQANLGVLFGDKLGMPPYIMPLTAFVFFISGFMQAYIRMSAVFPFYYLYGSIETQEKEKRQYNLDMESDKDNTKEKE